MSSHSIVFDECLHRSLSSRECLHEPPLSSMSSHIFRGHLWKVNLISEGLLPVLSYNSHKHVSPSTMFVVNTPKPTRGTRCTYTTYCLWSTCCMSKLWIIFNIIQSLWRLHWICATILTKLLSKLYLCRCENRHEVVPIVLFPGYIIEWSLIHFQLRLRSIWYCLLLSPTHILACDDG